MTTQHAHPDQPSPDAATCGDGGWASSMLQQDIAALGRLREIGMSIAEAMERQVAGAAAEDATTDVGPPIFTGDAVEAFQRLSRAVRMTAALRTRLIEHLERLDEVQEQRKVGLRRQRKAQVEHVLTSIIDDTLADGSPENADQPEAAERDSVERAEREAEEREDLIWEVSERLRQTDRFGDVLSRPVSEFIDLICRDVGLSPDWRRLAEEAWAQEEIRSGKVGAPLAEAAAQAARQSQVSPGSPSPGMGDGPGVRLEPSAASPAPVGPPHLFGDHPTRAETGLASP